MDNIVRVYYIIHVCMYVCVTLRNAILLQARVQDAAFVLLAHEVLEIRTNRSLLFTQVGLLQSLCSLCFSRDLTAGDGRYADQSRAIQT